MKEVDELYEKWVADVNPTFSEKKQKCWTLPELREEYELFYGSPDWTVSPKRFLLWLEAKERSRPQKEQK